MKTKQIKIQIQETEKGIKYFDIYEVVGTDFSGEKSTINTFINKEEAMKYKDFAYEVYNNLYRVIWIRVKNVWC